MSVASSESRRKRWGKRIGLCIIVAFFVCAFFGPAIAPYDPSSINLYDAFALPTANHWLGTADNGIDILSAILYGARVAALIAVPTVLISLVFGTLVGVLAGMKGGAFDHVIIGIADGIQSFPAIVLNVAVLAIVAEPSLFHLIVALAINGWVLYARVARAQTLVIREQAYVLAARAIGRNSLMIAVRHIIPNASGPLIVQATIGLGYTVLIESTLSFLGIGPTIGASWGSLLEQGTGVLMRFPHVSVIAGAVIALTVLGFHLTGDFLRDKLDPHHA